MFWCFWILCGPDIYTDCTLFHLTLSLRWCLSYKNQSIDLLCISMDWFLYDRDLHHERVKGVCKMLHAKLLRNFFQNLNWNVAWEKKRLEQKNVIKQRKEVSNQIQLRWGHRAYCRPLLRAVVESAFSKVVKIIRIFCIF